MEHFKAGNFRCQSHLESMPVARVGVHAAAQFAPRSPWAARSVFLAAGTVRPNSELREGGLKKIEEYLQKAARCREMAETVAPADRQRLEQIAQSLEMLAELEKRLPAEDDNVIEFVLPTNDPKRK
jgi:hypothetical protein